MHSDQEIELKLKLNDTPAIIQKLQELGAEFISEKEQEDVLFIHKYWDFQAHDQALRLRRETDQNGSTAELTFKGTPTHTADGHKIRDEFTSPVDPIQIKKILRELGIEDRYTLLKKRLNYQLDDIDIAIDQLKFGDYLELEGTAEAIEALRKKLDLENEAPITEGYIFIQWAYEGNDPADLGKF